MKRFLHAGQFRDKFVALREAYENQYRSLIERIRILASENPTERPSPLVDECLEYHARTYIINGFFEALNWPILCEDDLPALIPEAPVQSLERGTRRFLDYFGLHPNTQKPLLLIEAKRPSLYLPISSDPSDTQSYERYSRKIVEGLQGGSISNEWDEILRTTKDYVNSLDAHFHYSPLRVVITNGNWVILFINPSYTFTESAINSEEIIVFPDTDDICQRAAEIWEYLEYSNLVGSTETRILQIGELPFLIDPTKIEKFTLGIRLIYSEQPTHDKARPEIIVLPIVLIASQRKTWIVVQRKNHQGFDIPHKYEHLNAHLGEVSDFGSALLADVVHALNLQIVLSPLSAHYEQDEDGFYDFRGVQEIKTDLNRRMKEFIIVTGNEFHFIHNQPSISNCRYHSWINAHDDAVATQAPIITSGIYQPRSFFVNGQNHHCSHSTVLATKTSQLTADNRHMCGLRSGSNGAAFCEIIQIDEYLCCRTCIFEDICSQTEIFNLPCNL